MRDCLNKAGLMAILAQNRNFFYAVATLIGTIIGVGIFGLPYAFARAGFFVGLIQLFLLGAVVIIIQLIFGEIILRTKEKHSLPGYIDKYLGKKWETLISISVLVGIFGSMIAYILVGGTFLRAFFSHSLGIFASAPDTVFYIVFWIILTSFILLGLKMIEMVEFGMTIFLLIVIGGIFIFSAPYINIDNLFVFNGMNSFLPYGVILFALAGAVAVPEVREILVGQEKKIKPTIILGVLVPIIVYALFAFIVVGVTGSSTTEEAMVGLSSIVGGPIYVLGIIFGILAITTSYITFGYYLYETFLYDFGINRNLSHILIAIVPITFVLLGWRNFIAIISFLGAVMGGFESIAMILAYLKAKKIGDRTPEYSLKIPHFVYYFLILVFALGIIYTVAYRG